MSLTNNKSDTVNIIMFRSEDGDRKICKLFVVTAKFSSYTKLNSHKIFVNSDISEANSYRAKNFVFKQMGKGC